MLHLSLKHIGLVRELSVQGQSSWVAFHFYRWSTLVGIHTWLTFSDLDRRKPRDPCSVQKSQSTEMRPSLVSSLLSIYYGYALHIKRQMTPTRRRKTQFSFWYSKIFFFVCHSTANVLTTEILGSNYCASAFLSTRSDKDARIRIFHYPAASVARQHLDCTSLDEASSAGCVSDIQSALKEVEKIPRKISIQFCWKFHLVLPCLLLQI